jgi:hypothetical protein
MIKNYNINFNILNKKPFVLNSIKIKIKTSKNSQIVFNNNILILILLLFFN